MKRLFLSLFLCVFCLFCANAATMYVANQGLHVAPYSSWENAATSIQSAVEAAISADTILGMH